MSAFLTVIAFFLLVGSPLIVVGGTGAYAAWRWLPPAAQRRLEATVGDRLLAAIAWFATIWLAAWLGLYGWLRATGGIPGYEEWQHTGHRHGPWDDSAMLYLLPSAIVLLGVILPVAAAGIGAFRGIRRRTPALTARGIGVAVVSMSYAWLVVYLTYWLVD